MRVEQRVSLIQRKLEWKRSIRVAMRLKYSSSAEEVVDGDLDDDSWEE